MLRRNGKRVFFRSVVLLVGLLAVLGGCGSMEYTSRWRDRQVTVDGQNLEWGHALVRMEELPVMMGILNDSEYLYVTIQTSDRPTMRQIMFRGLTLWFDRTGGEEKRFGIRYPMGMQGMGARPPQDDRNGEGNREPNRDDMLSGRMPVDTTEIEILGPMENEHHRMSIIELRQINARFQIVDGALVYELRIPLTDNGAEPYAIGTSAGSVIGIGWETGGMMDRPAGREGMPPPGGREGMRGGRGRGGMEGGEPGRMGMQSKPLKAWGTLRLAAPVEGK
jgi:hypothetical protein